MQKDEPIIAECPLFVCRECHTKTGHPHQRWCVLRDKAGGGCSECLYLQPNDRCIHPYRKKGDEA
ncbi:MAG: hypothetical protein J6X60_05405 [Ruminiclostridium sp.]|nr:hypothetical protein [Ruminiclostridium sp.]